MPMLAFETLNAGSDYNRMPVDLSSYLLSSSPPGFDFYQYSSAMFRKLGSSDCKNDTDNSEGKRTGNNFNLKPIVPRRCPDEKSDSSEDLSITTEQDSEPSSPDSPLTPSSPTSTTDPFDTGKKKAKKRVKFADSFGLALVSVKIMNEPSDMPPQLKRETLNLVTEGVTASATQIPPLKVSFVQPASNYLEFREKVMNNNVSLENVILKDYTIFGTIKVKNITFHKNVFVHFTYDSWETFQDVPGEYVSSGTDSYQHNVFDTFSFKLSVPTNYDVSKKVEFCVCFETESEQFWDNNNGENYRILSEDWKCVQPKKYWTINDSDGVSSWTDFASWQHVDTTVPYW